MSSHALMGKEKIVDLMDDNGEQGLGQARNAVLVFFLVAFIMANILFSAGDHKLIFDWLCFF